MAGLAAHSFLPLEQSPAAAYALVLGMMGHAVGWPFPRSGAQSLANALAACLRALGGELATQERVREHQPIAPGAGGPAGPDATPVLPVAGHKLPASYLGRLGRFRYGPGVFKIDYAMDWPIPWKAAACARARNGELGPGPSRKSRLPSATPPWESPPSGLLRYYPSPAFSTPAARPKVATLPGPIAMCPTVRSSI